MPSISLVLPFKFYSSLDELKPDQNNPNGPTFLIWNRINSQKLSRLFFGIIDLFIRTLKLVFFLITNITGITLKHYLRTTIFFNNNNRIMAMKIYLKLGGDVTHTHSKFSWFLYVCINKDTSIQIVVMKHQIPVKFKAGINETIHATISC